MSECVKKKKLHIRCSLACSSCQLLDQRKNANEAATVAEELKRERDYSSGYYCAMFYLLNAKNKLGTVECVTDVLSIF